MYSSEAYPTPSPSPRLFYNTLFGRGRDGEGPALRFFFRSFFFFIYFFCATVIGPPRFPLRESGSFIFSDVYIYIIFITSRRFHVVERRLYIARPSVVFLFGLTANRSDSAWVSTASTHVARRLWPLGVKSIYRTRSIDLCEVFQTKYKSDVRIRPTYF